MAKDPRCRLCELPPSEWSLEFEGTDPALESTREALLTLGNGYLATRGAATPEAHADGVHYPGTFIAGIYNRLVSEMDEQAREDESLVNLPSWIPLTFRSAGSDWAAPGTADMLHQHSALDLRHGVLNREAALRDRAGRITRLRQRSFISMASPHLAVLETDIIPENWSGRLDVLSRLDGSVRNVNAAAFRGLADRHLTSIRTGTDGEDRTWLVAQTSQSKLRIAECARTVVLRAGNPARPERRSRADATGLGQELLIDVDQGESVTVVKTVAIYTSQDRAVSEPLLAAQEEVVAAAGSCSLLSEHATAWDELWRRFRLQLADGTQARQAVNAHMYHLLTTLSPHTIDQDVGVPARGLHGEGYQGHIFWDEIFVFPFLNVRLPELTRSLLLYRYRRLRQARRIAAQRGMKGALFPWQSGSDGREETPRSFYNPKSGRWIPDNSWRQYHVNLAVAYNIWHYWEVTADLGFMIAYGAEMLIEIARFWASLATYDPASDRYDIRGVMGPDEFHDGYPGRPGQGIDNSAYVNVMTSWALARASDACWLLGEHHGHALWQRLNLTEEERADWYRISKRLRVPFLENGMIAQFEGYGLLAELDWEDYQARYGDISRLDLILEAEGDTANRYQVSKQADVLMLAYLFTADELTFLLRWLGYPFDPAIIPDTVQYYLARTSHGSTLSRIVHVWALSQADRAAAWDMFCRALEYDLGNGHTREGVHLGAMAGTLDILQRCYTGLDTREDILWLSPLLPSELRVLEFDVHYRGHWITLRIDHEAITMHARPCAAPPVTLDIRGRRHELSAGTTLTIALADLPGPD